MPDNPGEFALIDKIRKLFGGLADENHCLGHGRCEGIGDDCAVIPVSDTESLVVTTDMLVEEVHFLRNCITPFLLGRKSLAVNLSDVAAMGAKPLASFLSISLPADIGTEWIDEFLRGYHDISSEFGTALLGGDTTSSPDKVVISVTAIGRAANKHIKRRSAAATGDIVLVAGQLGDSAQGLIDIRDGNCDTAFTLIHNNPAPQVREGIWLGEQHGVHAMTDLSDGLASDLLHILEESGVAANVKVEEIPHSTSVEQAVTGGEDYKLLLTVDAGEATRICEGFLEKFGYPLTGIGTITAGEPAITWTKNGKIITPSWKGYTHF